MLTRRWTNPHLSESDARLLTRKIVTELRALGANVEAFGVHLEREGFYFMAAINGQVVHIQTGQGAFTYAAVARELLHAALQARAASPALVTS